MRIPCVTAAADSLAARQAGDLDMVKLLLARGAKVETTDTSHGASAVHLAAYSGRLDVLKLLDEVGGDILVSNDIFQKSCLSCLLAGLGL